MKIINALEECQRRNNLLQAELTAIAMQQATIGNPFLSGRLMELANLASGILEPLFGNESAFDGQAITNVDTDSPNV